MGNKSRNMHRSAIAHAHAVLALVLIMTIINPSAGSPGSDKWEEDVPSDNGAESSIQIASEASTMCDSRGAGSASSIGRACPQHHCLKLDGSCCSPRTNNCGTRRRAPRVFTNANCKSFTGATCAVFGCNESRLSDCKKVGHSGWKCVCPKGKCAYQGKCISLSDLRDAWKFRESARLNSPERRAQRRHDARKMI